uniref:Putative secreted protein n=1 Tax=Ixodes ricinus TaxID=34613 RepID=A0A6B0UP56_IXORI
MPAFFSLSASQVHGFVVLFTPSTAWEPPTMSGNSNRTAIPNEPHKGNTNSHTTDLSRLICFRFGIPGPDLAVRTFWKSHSLCTPLHPLRLACDVQGEFHSACTGASCLFINQSTELYVPSRR